MWTCWQVTLTGHRGAVSAMRYNAAGGTLATGAQDTDIILWDVAGEAGLFRLRGHTGEVTDLVLAPDAALEACTPTWCRDLQETPGGPVRRTFSNPCTVCHLRCVIRVVVPRELGCRGRRACIYSGIT